MKLMHIENDPNLIGGTILTFMLAGTGQVFHEILIHVPLPELLHWFVSIAKGFSYIGSGLVGIATIYKTFKKPKK